eukprot:CAMPEP_0172609264 /NCGR_PEP_ID=MMETSP1068-20121228/29277_1 /TAXON_ID=35684 /ORGANISM="Pseudopedinella elastica, Strain CCMP716" /LENGTH=457 /DNA_ID=CAMNT_0013412751 /DNA_START=142 /DNA_END=1515 /DNA_ORIENTATION=-
MALSAAPGSVMIRVRSQIGMWRFNGVDPSEPVIALQQRLESEKNIPIHQQSLSQDPSGQVLLSPEVPLANFGICSNGDVVHLRIDPNAEALVAGPAIVKKKKIGADGSIVAVDYFEQQKDKGFRPGMPRLRDIKNTWTLSDFLEMDEQFVYRFEKPKEGEADEARKSEMCLGAHLHMESVGSFVSSLQGFGWGQCRMGYLYGTVDEAASKVTVEALYEPPQEVSPSGFEALEDPRAEQVAHLAKLLGMQRVGCILAHPPREDGFVLSSSEVLFAGLQQLEAADGVNKTPFVTLRVYPQEDGSGATDALQVTLQCMDMVAEGALEESETDRSALSVPDTFTAIVEGKEGVKTVDCSRFLLNVPVLANEAPRFKCAFPPANRVSTEPQSPEALKRCILASGGSVTEAVKDFGLLLYLMDFREMFDWEHFMPRICTAATTLGAELDEGDKLIISSIAGII